MVEVLLSLAGVVVGGVIGLGGTYLQTKNQRYIRRREEVLPIAGRALAAAEESYQALVEYEIATRTTADTPEKRWQIRNEASAQHTRSYRQLRIALHELSLLIRGIGNESKQLRETVSLWNPNYSNPRKTQMSYDNAREALLERVRQHLGT